MVRLAAETLDMLLTNSSMAVKTGQIALLANKGYIVFSKTPQGLTCVTNNNQRKTTTRAVGINTCLGDRGPEKRGIESA
jgi:UDP-N-acetylmuramyl tripeptide synthase